MKATSGLVWFRLICYRNLRSCKVLRSERKNAVCIFFGCSFVLCFFFWKQMLSNWEGLQPFIRLSKPSSPVKLYSAGGCLCTQSLVFTYHLRDVQLTVHIECVLLQMKGWEGGTFNRLWLASEGGCYFLVQSLHVQLIAHAPICMTRQSK